MSFIVDESYPYAFCRIRSIIFNGKQGLWLQDVLEPVFSSSPLTPLAMSKA